MAWTGSKPPLRARDWVVQPMSELSVARRLCRFFHYAKGASNTRTYLHGLYPVGYIMEEDCEGAAWWIPPTKGAAMALAGDAWGGVLALSRLVVSPDVPGNGATFLMSASLRKIDRQRWPVLVTYADSWRGHTGAIYKATGWTDDGDTKPESVYTLRGRMIARKAGGKTRTHAEMIELGAEFLGRFPKRRFIMRAP